MIKVSIMITCYNCEACIDNAINSVIVQDMPFEWELLIGDDGSRDNTVSHVNEWINKYPNNIKLFILPRDINEKKDGTRAAKNRANLLEKAKGEYLIFLDGDDCFLGTEKIREQVKILDNPAFKKCSCVAHNIVANDIVNEKKYAMTPDEIESGIVNSKKYWKEMYFHTNTILFRNSCKKTMLDIKYRNFLNDNFITYIILQKGAIYYINKLWAQYNLTGEGLWTGKNRVYGCFRNLILYDLEIRLNQDMESESFIRHLYDFRYILTNYLSADKSAVMPLVEHLNIEDFPFTWLLYRFDDELTAEEKKDKDKLCSKVSFIFTINRLFHVPKKLKEIIRKRR